MLLSIRDASSNLTEGLFFISNLHCLLMIMNRPRVVLMVSNCQNKGIVYSCRFLVEHRSATTLSDAAMVSVVSEF